MFDIIGLGNALVDIEIVLSEEQLSSLGVVKNSMTLISLEERIEVLKKLDKLGKTGDRFASGGAVCNTLCGIAKKSKGELKVGMMGFLGKDFHGDKYLEDLAAVGVEFLGKRIKGETGTCLVLITPDGNRTMLTTLGCASNLDDATLAGLTSTGPGVINTTYQTRHFLAESYLLFGQENINKIRNLFKRLAATPTLTILSDSDAFCIEQEGKIYQELFGKVDVFFSNGEQAKAMMGLERTDATSVGDIVKQWHKLPMASSPSFSEDEPSKERAVRAPLLVVTDGEHGAYLLTNRLVHVPAIATKVVDTTGAGDAFSAGVLSGYLKGESLEIMGKLGAEMASTVIARYGARW